MASEIGFRKGVVVAPHAAAADAGREILRAGGNAIEAAIATAATLSVVYPHMTGLGGDAFWLVHRQDVGVRALQACGQSAGLASLDWYAARQLHEIPRRGPAAALTVAGAVSSWGLAYAYSRAECGGRLPFSLLLEPAIACAREGVAVTESQQRATTNNHFQLAAQPGFAATYLSSGRPHGAGATLKQPRLAATLQRLAEAGAEDFYRGELATLIASDLEALGSPVRQADLNAHKAHWQTPLRLRISAGELFNTPAPTQGVASLLILGIYDRLRTGLDRPDTAAGIHLLVEATKQAFKVRDRCVADPRDMDGDAGELLADAHLDRLAQGINPSRAQPWPGGHGPGDTTWFGAMDDTGLSVSAIQSLYFEYGSGMVLPSTGICWQNRGCAFSLDARSRRRLQPGRMPFHTLNPALALLGDGRVLAYGSMGGDGQPQTQAAVFTRYVYAGDDPQTAVSAPRWLLGRTWGDATTSLKLENRFASALIEELRQFGHPVERVGDFDERMGHAGILVRHPDDRFTGGCDPRSDGAVAAL